MFAEWKNVCRVHYIGHSAKKILAECFKKTLGKIIALGKKRKKNTRQSLALGKPEKKTLGKEPPRGHSTIRVPSVSTFAECPLVKTLGKQIHSAKEPKTLGKGRHSAKKYVCRV